MYEDKPEPAKLRRPTARGGLLSALAADSEWPDPVGQTLMAKWTAAEHLDKLPDQGTTVFWPAEHDVRPRPVWRASRLAGWTEP